ncbi:macro domain-containing protein [Burkholderia sp. PU8-34]
MKLTLCAVIEPLYQSFAEAFAGVSDVTVLRTDILTQSADAIVSPANSFGWMDGGIDLLYRRRFGLSTERRLIQCIADRPGCELPVGEAVAIETGDRAIPIMIAAPTMRVPALIGDTDNAYRAFRAALRIARMRGMQSLLAPGMGTGVGRMYPVQAAAQMLRAYREIVVEDLI